MDIAEIIADRKILEAMERGEFENLPGAGKPLLPDGLDMVPDDLRAAYKLLRNAGYVPEEAELRREIVTLNDLLRVCENGGERESLSRKICAAELRLSMLLEKRKSEVMNEYREKMLSRFR